MACKSRAEISEKVREEVGFRVVRTADRSGRAEFGQFPGDAAGFGELLGGKLLGGRLGYILMGSGPPVCVGSPGRVGLSVLPSSEQ
jgi:hypothetical protein